MKLFLVMAIAASLSGCVVHRVQDVSLPDGRHGFAVRCNGTRHGWADCMNQAGETCGGAYDVYTQDQSTGQFSELTAGPNSLQGFSVPVRHREMIFACKVSQAK